MGPHCSTLFYINNRIRQEIFAAGLWPGKIQLSCFTMAAYLTGLLPHRSANRAMMVLALLFCASAHGLTEVPRTFDELAQLSELVIVGTVKEIRSEFADNGPDQNIVSYVTFDDLQMVKGDSAAPEYVLQVLGGVVGRFAQDYPGIPVFRTGQRYMVFIRGNHRDFFPVVGVTQGVFRVLTNSQGQQVVVRDDMAGRAGRRALSTVIQGAPTLDSFVQRIRAGLMPVAPAAE